MARIKLEALNAAVINIIKKYGDNVVEGIKVGTRKIGNEAVKRLKDTSPRRSGRYASSWRKKEDVTRLATAITIYSDDRYQLSHLLEKGHRGPYGKGWVPAARIHIHPVQEWCDRQMEGMAVRVAETAEAGKI